MYIWVCVFLVRNAHERLHCLHYITLKPRYICSTYFSILTYLLCTISFASGMKEFRFESLKRNIHPPFKVSCTLWISSWFILLSEENSHVFQKGIHLVRSNMSPWPLQTKFFELYNYQRDIQTSLSTLVSSCGIYLLRKQSQQHPRFRVCLHLLQMTDKQRHFFVPLAFSDLNPYTRRYLTSLPLCQSNDFWGLKWNTGAQHKLNT